MDNTFSSNIAELRRFNIELVPGNDAGSERTLEAGLVSIPGIFVVTDPGKRIFKRVPEASFSNLLKDVVRAAKSRHFSVKDLAVLTSETKRDDIPAPKLLVFYKLLEEISIRSENEAVWREAMNTLAVPLYNISTRSEFREKLAVSCLSNIRACGDQKKIDLSLEISAGARKVAFAVDMFSGAIFSGDRRRECRAVSALACLDHKVVLAALVARTLTSTLPSPWIIDRLIEAGAAADPREGKDMILALAYGNSDASPDNVLYDKVMGGLREILGTKPLPHPWFLETPGRLSRLPVPRLDEHGIQMAAFSSLARIPSSPAALLTAVDGISQLVVPHVSELRPDGVATAESNVGKAMVKLSEVIYGLLSRNPALQPFQAKVASSLLFGHPERLSPDEVGRSYLLRLSPLMCRVAVVSARAGAENAFIARIARNCLGKAFLPDDFKSAQDVMRSADVFLSLQDQMFGTKEPSLPDRQLTFEFLHRIANKKPLLPRTPHPALGHVKQKK
jgi:hypothetical protein